LHKTRVCSPTVGLLRIMLRAAGVILCVTVVHALPTVTLEKFDRAETDRYMKGFVSTGAAGKFIHNRKPMVIVPGKPQDVVRSNRDTLYSWAVLDLRECGANITFPESHGRYASVNRITEQHDTIPSIYTPGKYMITKENSGGFDYHVVNLRIFVNPNDPKDIEAVNAYQDKFLIEQSCDGSHPDIPEWDPVSLDKIRNAFETLFSTTEDQSAGRMFGMVKDLDQMRHMMGVAVGWAGLRPTDTIYQSYFPAPEFADGATPMTITLPADKQYFEEPGFWSVTMYDKTGMMYENPPNMNVVTALKNNDGSYTINLGNCGDASRINCLPLTKGWNFVARMYRPAPGIVEDEYAFPHPVPSQNINIFL